MCFFIYNNIWKPTGKPRLPRTENKMKRILLLILTFAVATACLCACDSFPQVTPGGNDVPDPTPAEFSIKASSQIFTLGGEPVILSIDGERPDGYSASDLEFYISDGLSSGATITDGALSFTAPGSVTVSARLGDLESKNTVTVTAVNSNETVASMLSTALATNTYLGQKLDIGISESNAHLYSLDAPSDFAVIRPDGRLELTGIRSTSSRIRLYYGDEIIYEGMYTMENSPLNKRIISSLIADGKLANSYSDVPASLLTTVTSLDLSGYFITDPAQYDMLRYFTALETLDLSECNLYDLTFLEGISTLKTLIIDNCRTVINTDAGLSIYNTLESLTSLEELSIVGAFSCFDRTSYNMLTSMVNRGNFALRVLDGITLTGENVYQFSETVFFSYTELKTHLDANNNAFKVADGYSHAILSLAGETVDLSEWYVRMDTSSLTIIELYGATGKSYGMSLYYYQLSSTKSLAVNMYNYSLSVKNDYGRSAIDVPSGSSLAINAMRGYCYIRGGNGFIGYAGAANAISAPWATVELRTFGGASLEIAGGNGDTGRNGAADGSDPDSITTAKGGGRGSDGGHGVYAKYVSLYSTDITVWGGNGGKGGDGGAGTGVNIFTGGYNGGHGGNGGNGGYALCCEDYNWREFQGAALLGGLAGDGGNGGEAYLAGHDGNPGNPGDPGNSVTYR